MTLQAEHRLTSLIRLTDRWPIAAVHDPVTQPARAQVPLPDCAIQVDPPTGPSTEVGTPAAFAGQQLTLHKHTSGLIRRHALLPEQQRKQLIEQNLAGCLKKHHRRAVITRTA